MDPYEKLGNFMTGFAAANQLLNRAGKSGFFVEFVVLAASVIDSTLRIGIILKRQLREGNRELIEELLEQPEDSRGFSERKIYKWALEDGVISQDLFDDLEDLYDRRNRVIHRYIISRITTDQVLDIAILYEKMIPRVSLAIEELEKEQIALGVGMTVEGPDMTPGWLDEFAREKHSSLPLSKAIESDENA